MDWARCGRPGRDPRPRTLTVLLVLGGGLGPILYSHGASWWYALAVLAFVLAHVALLGGVVFVAARFTRGRHTSVASRQEGAGHAHQGESIVLHSPRSFDWMVRMLTLGREGKLRQWMLDLAELRPGNLVLDVGCGTGTLLLAAAERVGPSGALHGIEPSAEMRQHARHKAEKRGVPLEIVEGSADRLPYPSSSVDAVFCTLVLHHLPGPMQEAAIREMWRVLRPGGRAVIVEWQGAGATSLARAITGPLSLISRLHELAHRGSTESVPDVEGLLTGLGFERITRHPYGSGALGAVVGRRG